MLTTWQKLSTMRSQNFPTIVRFMLSVHLLLWCVLVSDKVYFVIFEITTSKALVIIAVSIHYDIAISASCVIRSALW